MRQQFIDPAPPGPPDREYRRAPRTEWPGLWSAPGQIGNATVTARRPQVFFDPKSYMPEAAELELTVPPAFSSAEEFRALVSDALRALEEKHQQDVASQGRRFLGPVRVLAQNPFAHPPAGERRFELEPRIAARDKWRRVEGLLRLKSFLRAYRQSWLDRRAGTPNVQFQRAPTSCASCTACNAQEQRRSPRLRTRVRNAAGRARASVADVCVEEPIRASLAEE